MQRHDFEDGGFVLHKVPEATPACRSHLSAWYDRTGTLLDAERLYTDGRARPVKPGGLTWSRLAYVGWEAARAFKTAPTAPEPSLAPENAQIRSQEGSHVP